MQKTTVYLPEGLARDLRELSARTGRSQADLIRTAVHDLVSGQGRPRPRSVGLIDDPDGPPASTSKQWVKAQWERDAGRRRAGP